MLSPNDVRCAVLWCTIVSCSNLGRTSSNMDDGVCDVLIVLAWLTEMWL